MNKAQSLSLKYFRAFFLKPVMIHYPLTKNKREHIFIVQNCGTLAS